MIMIYSHLQVMEKLKISRYTLNRYLKENRLTQTEINKNYFITDNDLNDFLNLLTIKQASTELKISIAGVLWYIKNNKLTVTRIGKKTLVKKTDLENLKEFRRENKRIKKNEFIQ